MTNETPTIIGCFQESLPTFKSTKKVEYKKVQASSKTTEVCVPPYVLLCHRPAESCEFLRKAETMLEYLNGHEEFGKKTIAPAFPEYRMDNEAELSNLTDSQILQPIYEFLHLRWPKKFSIRREMSPEKEEGGTDTSVRFDIVFNTDESGQEKQIMVLELKRRGQIRYNDFARLNSSQPANGLMDHDSSQIEVEKRIKTIARSKHESAFTGNAIPYLKQVSKYANAGKGCPYVAIFNWDHLLLFKFNEKSLRPQNGTDETTAGEAAELTWISETNTVYNDEEKSYIREDKIRKALLGYMLVAFEAALGTPAVFGA